MKIGLFHPGSGLGNQLHRYVATRVFSMEAGESFAMIGDFKGKDLMDLEMFEVEYPAGKIDTDHSVEIIDGEFQGQQVWGSYLDSIREWLKVEPMFMPDDLCVINFRGGEYVGVKDLFLPKSYWDEGIKMMLEINPNMIFEVHTDDPDTAAEFFPTFNIISNIQYNWRAIRYAKYLLLSNSSFAILPAHLNQDVKKIIAPTFWAGYNVGRWLNPDNEYDKFTYI